QIGVRLQAHGAGHLVAAEERAHVATVEMMTSAVLAGIAYRTGTDSPKGYMTAALARRLLEPGEAFDAEVVDPRAVENPVGGCGGTIFPVDGRRKVRPIPNEAGCPGHP